MQYFWTIWTMWMISISSPARMINHQWCRTMKQDSPLAPNVMYLMARDGTRWDVVVPDGTRRYPSRCLGDFADVRWHTEECLHSRHARRSTWRKTAAAFTKREKGTVDYSNTLGLLEWTSIWFTPHNIPIPWLAVLCYDSHISSGKWPMTVFWCPLLLTFYRLFDTLLPYLERIWASTSFRSRHNF